jgi:hypothetical protein
MKITTMSLWGFIVLALPVVHAVDDNTLTITQVRIIDVAQGKVLPASTVVIKNGRIARIQSVNQEVPPGQVLNADNAFLVPGFWDMHAHVNDFEPRNAREWLLPSMLVAGVTGVRDLSGDCWQEGCAENIKAMRELQYQLNTGAQLGPRLLAIGSGIVNGPRELEDNAPAWSAPADAAQAVRLVHELKARGVDFIKPYDSMPREVYMALIREARVQGIPIGGHIPLSVTTVEALEMGQWSIEHARHPLLDCSTASDDFHAKYARWTAQAGRAPRLSASKFYHEILQGFDAARCTAIITQMAQAQSYYVPTIITRKFEAYADDPSFNQDTRLSSVPKSILESWQEEVAQYTGRFKASSRDKQDFVRFYQLGREWVGQAWRAGVPILVGTDTPDSYCFPGASFHDELVELSAAGMSNAAILRAATLSAAQFLERENDFGSVTEGKVADLLLLTANPLDDIRHTQRIKAVVFKGEVFDHQRLTAIRQQVSAYVAAP